MRSRNSSTESSDRSGGQHLQSGRSSIGQEEEEEEKERKRRKLKDGRGRAPRTTELSKADLLQLLGIMEGEVQARDDIISLLRSDRTGPETLEAHYGSAAPYRPLLALQRDQMLVEGNRSNDDVYEKPMAELERLEEQQKETYRRMLEQLLLAEKCHRRTVSELDNEKRKHVDFMTKSDDFTDLLEQDRERLKKLLEQEKSFQAHRDKEQCRRLEKVKEELVKLKSFTLVLVDERQLHMEQMGKQNQKIQDLTVKLKEAQCGLAAAYDAAKADGEKVRRLETEMERKTTKFSQEHEEMNVKMGEQEVRDQQLRLQLVMLSQKVEELESKNKELLKSEEDLQELRQKISRGECGSSSLVAELENLRKKVLEMDGKDEDLTKAESQCQDLRRHLQEEENRSKELTLEVNKLQKRMVELEKLEEMFGRTRKECSQVHTNLEKERHVVKDLAGVLEAVKTRLKELESSQSKMATTEAVLREDLLKMKSLTVVLVDERNTLAEKLKREERKSEETSRWMQTEQAKVTEVTEKLIEESKKVLKVKSEMELQVTSLTKEKEELMKKLATEEDRCQELHLQLSRTLKAEMQRNHEIQKVEELNLEVERLRSRLKQLEVVEGDLVKTEDQYDLLEKQFRTEQDKANALAKLLEEVKSQMARNKATEKGEMLGQREEAKTRELQANVQALKEKIHTLMTKEDQLSQLQVDYAVLQQRFLEEGLMKKHMSQQVESLTRELEATKCYSRALRPSSSGQRMVEVPVTSRAVQTDVWTEEETTAGFIHKSVLEENNVMSNLRRQGLKIPKVLERFPPASADLAARRSLVSWMRKKEALSQDQTKSETRSPQTAGQPLHIRVTPGPEKTRATLEITSPGAEDFFSSTTIIPTLGLHKPRITIVPKTTTLASNPRADSPVTITTISRSRSPGSCGGPGSAGVQSPVSIITVSTTPVVEAHASPKPSDQTSSPTKVQISSERPPGPGASQRFSSNGRNIVTTEDSRIHIHLRAPPDGRRGPALTIKPLGEENSKGTLVRSPIQNSTGKKTSSLMITPSWSTLSEEGAAETSSSPNPMLRIPEANGAEPPTGTKAPLGLSTVARFDSRSMKIQLRKRSTESMKS